MPGRHRQTPSRTPRERRPDPRYSRFSRAAPPSRSRRVLGFLASFVALVVAVTGLGFYIGNSLLGDEANRFSADRLTAPDTRPSLPELPRADRAQRSPDASSTATPSASGSAVAPRSSSRASRSARPRSSAPATTQPMPGPSAPGQPPPSGPEQRRPAPSATPSSEDSCQASFYDGGDTTASGQPFDPNGMTAAHKTLPFGTQVKVTNTANDESVIVRINDRGPLVEGRCLDLSRGAFQRIASVDDGVITVRLEVV